MAGTGSTEDKETAKDKETADRLFRKVAVAGAVLLVGILAGTVAAFVAVVSPHPWASFGQASLIALGALLSGAVAGLIFGLPRASAPQPSGQGWYLPSSTLQEVADWLTKIIVGVTLIQFGPISDAFLRMSQSAGVAMGLQQGAQPTGAAIILAFAAIGFIFMYIWSRTELEEILLLVELINRKRAAALTPAPVAGTPAPVAGTPAPVAGTARPILGKLRLMLGRPLPAPGQPNDAPPPPSPPQNP